MSHVLVVIDSRSDAENGSGGDPDTTSGNDSGPDCDEPADQTYQTTADSSGDNTNVSQEDKKWQKGGQLHRWKCSPILPVISD